ncbi:MAG TPA: DNA polymerase III subunit epsilon [Thermoanaerobaculia bacterium]|nr:DNA polymerase III subunit epsilon [Thermoanaerobaculia bacterium]
MREIVLDTETTGLDPADGHRIVEIAGLELFNHLPTGKSFQRYVNPERDMPEDARAVHGIGAEQLAGKPKFGEIADELLAFLADAPLVIHNADFDIGFLNVELARLGRPPLPRARAIDTLALARRKFPGAQASLDALCRRFEIDTSARAYHGALVDCDLLSKVYLELIGGRQATLELASGLAPAAGLADGERPFHPPRPHGTTPEELAAHAALVARLKKPVWLA